jgi:pectate lyase
MTAFIKKPFYIVAVLVLGFTLPTKATILVSNVWNTGVRTYPAYNDPNSPYSEMGVDYNNSGDLESAWFQGGSGTLEPVGAGGPLRGTGYTTSSASWTTYFTPESNPVTLSGAGDQLKVTWVFTPTTLTANTSQGFPIALVDTPSASRLTSDNSPGSAAYTGYGVFMNMAPTLSNAHAFQLVTRNSGSAALLSSSGAWTGVADGAVNGNHGYDSGTQYTFVMTITRNASAGLDIVATMSGGTLNNSGVASASYTDSTPNGGAYTFDTFSLRPNSAAKSASQFDTSLFQVEFTPGNTPPSIDLDPQPDSVLVGQTASFTVQDSGTAPLSYQWYYNTNTVLNNQTNIVLTLPDVQLTNSGGYSVVVTNISGSVTSAVAQLTVSTPVAPSISTQPQDQTNILPGATATFTVVAGGSDPLTYQWFYNTNTPLANATDSTLIITNVQLAVAGSYSVAVSNTAGGVISTNAFLTVNTNSVAPTFISQPASQIVLVGGTASFSATADGTAPINYQWNKNGVPISGATSSTLNVTNVQVTDSGSSYTVTASNSVNSVTSSGAVLTVTATVPVVNSEYNLTGFATVGAGCTGGGILPSTDPNYAQVYTATDLANALNSKTVKIIEIMTNLDLGYNEIESTAKATSEPFRTAPSAPLTHPVLLQTGVSYVDIQKKNGLTIFSANGSAIRHAKFNIKSDNNIIVRNLKFDQLFEWDEATKGQYDRNDWDFITLGDGGAVSNIWVDHCTFTKSYDGNLDTKAGCSDITISWCNYVGDDGATNTNSWVWQQINYLEQSPSSYPMYNFLRTHGFSTTNIVTIMQAHDKAQLAGQNDLDPNNATIDMTFHHLHMGVWDRCVPRLRGGNVHDYNIYVDDTLVLAAERLRNAIAATMSTANQNTLNNTYSFEPPVNGAISTESGALLVEKSVYIDCLWPLRNNQTDPSNPAYTGKIQSLDSIYQFDSTTVRGNSTDPGNPMGPLQAPVIPFSWNLPGNQLPYSYTPDDPAQLQAIVTSPTAGAGAGVLTWNKTNWLMTTYPATAPFVVAQPQNTTNTIGQSATFTVVVGGTGPLAYQWYYNTNTPVANATNSALTINNIQTTNAGTYSVTVTNIAGSVTSTNAILAASSANTTPQLSDFTFSNGTFSLTINGNSGPDYIVQASTNLVDWVNIFTNHSPVPPFVWSDTAASNFSKRFYRVQRSP